MCFLALLFLKHRHGHGHAYRCTGGTPPEAVIDSKRHCRSHKTAPLAEYLINFMRSFALRAKTKRPRRLRASSTRSLGVCRTHVCAHAGRRRWRLSTENGVAVLMKKPHAAFSARVFFARQSGQVSAHARGSIAVRKDRQKAKGMHIRASLLLFGDPCGNRTHHFAVRGRRLSRLTNGPCWSTLLL